LNKINPVNSYKETQIKTASQGKLILMMYEGAVKYLKHAESELKKDKPKLDSANTSITKAQDLITELTVSLDFEKGGEIASNLFSLYMFFNQELRAANFKKDPEPIKRIRSMLEDLQSAWVEAVKKAGEKAQMPANGINIAG
jgi:flagellar protein FliS